MIGLFLATAAAGPFDDDASLQAYVDTEAAVVADRRDLTLLGPVPARLSAPDDLRAHIEVRLDEELDADELAAQTATLVAFGLADPGFDLYATYRDVLVEQIEGFFDPRERALFLVHRPEGDTALDPLVVEHELVHALQDQHFGLSQLDTVDLDDSDLTLALRSLVEGDATFFNVVTMAGDFLDVSTVPLRMTGRGEAAEGSALSAAPDIVATQLLFPYTDGAAFCQHLHANGSFAGINHAFSDAPPLSTEHVLHPERRTAATPDWPLRVELPDLSAIAGAPEVDADTLGELGVRVWLRDVGGIATSEAPIGWGGDRYVTHWDRGVGMATVTWMTTWDTTSDADIFADHARDVAEGLVGRHRWGKDGTVGRKGRFVAMVRSDRDVVLAFGPDRGRMAALAAAAVGAPRSPRTSVDVFRSE